MEGEGKREIGIVEFVQDYVDSESPSLLADGGSGGGSYNVSTERDYSKPTFIQYVFLNTYALSSVILNVYIHMVLTENSQFEIFLNLIILNF